MLTHRLPSRMRKFVNINCIHSLHSDYEIICEFWPVCFDQNKICMYLQLHALQLFLVHKGPCFTCLSCNWKDEKPVRGRKKVLVALFQCYKCCWITRIQFPVQTLKSSKFKRAYNSMDGYVCFDFSSCLKTYVSIEFIKGLIKYKSKENLTYY